MIKTLNMLAAGSDVPIADERKKFSRMMLRENIEEHPDFKALYKIDPGVLERIVQSMKKTDLMTVSRFIYGLRKTAISIL